jgi:hypothetical protein
MKRHVNSLIILVLSLNLPACVSTTSHGEIQRLKGATTYNVTAVPTIFAKSIQPAPSVKLNWAYADSHTLKMDVTVTGFDPNVNIDDLVCDPYMNTKQPIQFDSMTRNVKRFTSQQGNPIELTYEYNLNPPMPYKSLDMEVDLTLGPCANSVNFQESNVTPSVIPDLIGNYHLNFQIPVQ